MKYVMLEVGANGRIRGEYPAFDVTEKFDDLEDVIDNLGSEGLISLGGQPPYIFVDLERRDPSREEPYFYIKGIVVPKKMVKDLQPVERKR